MENNKALVTEEKLNQLSEIINTIKGAQGRISIAQYESLVCNLFVLVPELESIQKNTRLRVLLEYK